jgi:hypothetical protein
MAPAAGAGALAAVSAIPVVGGMLGSAIGGIMAHPAKFAQGIMQFTFVGAVGTWVVFGTIGFLRENAGQIKPDDYIASAPSGLMPDEGSGGGSPSSNGNGGSGGGFIGKPVNDLLAASKWPKRLWPQVRYIIMHESGGYANASPESPPPGGYYMDSNARAGTPTIGLMMIITYNDKERQAMKDPLANVNKGYQFYQQRGWQPWTTAGGSSNQNFTIKNA